MIIPYLENNEMEIMMNYFIKYFALFLYSIFIYLKLINQTFKFKRQYLTFFIIAVSLSSISYLLNIYMTEISLICPLFILWLFLNTLSTLPQITFVGLTIAFGLSYGLFTLSCFILLIPIIPQYYNKSVSTSLILIIALLLEFLFIYKLFNIKRFRKGMPFLFSTRFLNIATIISLFIIIFSINLNVNIPPNFYTKQIIPYIFILAFVFLIYWWQSQLTKTYKQRLILRELESLRTEVQEKDKLIEILKEQNEELGRLIHRDNKRIPAMEHAVIAYLNTEFENSEKQKEKGFELQQEIQRLSTSRANKLADINRRRNKLYATGIPSLDVLLNYMTQHAAQNQTLLSVHIAVDLNEYIPKCIATEDFTHMLSDLLDNACIAAKYADKRIIQLQFYVHEKIFVLEIADSGIPFKPETLANFGLSRQTTHADAGGSGIGLMDIWKIKEKYRATLHIQEYEEEAPYTKKITILFNKKNQYTIQTYRKEKFLQKIERSDLQIYNYGI